MGAEMAGSFAELLKQYRAAVGLTQEELAERAGLSARAISDLERQARQHPYPHTVQRLIQALDLAEDDAARLQHTARRSALPQRQAPLEGAGIHTFLVADLRNYTAFTHERGDEAAATLTRRFAAVAREVAAVGGGEVIELRGDEVLLGFVSARGALRAAVTLQERLAAETDRDPDFPLPAGVGLDAGEAVPVEGGYRGGALNLAARLCALAGPGEVFASDGVIHLARALEELVYLDRGSVPLKGLPEPVRVIHVVREGAAPEAVPRFSFQPAQRLSLPIQPTSFIGRQQEVEEVRAMLGWEEVRLLTLTGPGGVGKTRLALRTAEAVQDRFPDGIIFVSLAPLADLALVPTAIASNLKVTEVSGEPILETLTRHLRQKQLLLVLDNFEHLLDVGVAIPHLLAWCPRLKILVTSRAVLHLAAEHEYPVPALPVPTLGHLPEVDTLSRYDAVQLFVQRARAVRPGFELTEENGAAVADICSRLDGLPLALELAAACIRIFPPHVLLRRLSSRLHLLTGGPRDAPARQHTLRNTIDWSYLLLSEVDRSLFARLSVFAGGCSFEAAEAVCNPQGDLDLFEGLASLLDKSLLRQEGEPEPRFRMLETLREYAREQLSVQGESDDLQVRYAEYYTALAEEASLELTGGDQLYWLDILEREHNNLRAALAWSRDAGSELGLRLAAALWRFWAIHGHLTEGRRWLDTMVTVARERETDSFLQAQALNGAGNLARRQGDYDHARRLFDESLRIRQQLGDKQGIVRTLGNLGIVARHQGKYRRAAALHGQALQLSRELGDARGVVLSFRDLGALAELQGAYERAEELYEESLRLSRELGNRSDTAQLLGSLGVIAERQGLYERARELHAEALRLRWELGDKLGIAAALVGLAAVAGLRQEHARATQLLGAADAVWTSIEATPETADRERTESVSHDAYIALRIEDHKAAWSRGQGMSLEEAITYALE
jgi:non-specific serine/threonine protein kinase